MRSRPVGLPKVSVAAAAVVLVFSACSGDERNSETSSTTLPTTTAAMSASSRGGHSAPSATTSTTTTTSPAVTATGIGETLLVVGDDGVYQISAEGDLTLLVAGPVAYAVDDTQGGLLFQVDRGRNWDEADGSSTIVWWIPRGTSTPQELLVPAPATDHSLSLHDAYPTDDGFAVLYVRHEGSTPNVDITDRLRRFDVPAREVTELYSQGAFEHGFGQVSTNGELIAGVWFQQIGSGCFIYDLEGQPTDLVPSAVSDRPSDDEYVRGCRLSPDGDRLSFFTEQYEDNRLASTTLHVWDLDADTETTRFVIPSTAGIPRNLDVSATKAMAGFAGEDGQQTLVFNLNAPEADPIALPIAGRARFVDTPVEIGAPVHVGAGPDYYRYGDDGLYRVVDGVETQLNGDSVFWAYDDLMGGVVYRQSYDESRDVLWLGASADEPESLPVTGVWDAALVDGQPMLLVSVADPEWELCPDYDFGGPVMLHDLATGDRTFLHCHEEGPDGGLSTSRTSLGAGTIVSVEWVMSTDRRIVFQDLSGQEVTVDTNPVAEPCWPCHLSAEISDDGAFLAYSMWPTGFWPLPDEDHEPAYETWRATAETIPVEVAVLDLDSGRELWHTTLDPGIRLADFDGRYVVTRPSFAVDFGATGSVIYDTWGIHEPVEVEGGVALIRQPHLVLRHDGLGAVSFGDPVDDVVAVLTELLGPPDVVESQNSPEVDVSVQWDHPFLHLQFTYWDYFDAAPQPPGPMPAGPVFHYYLVKSGDYASEAGIAVGDTVGDLEAAHPSVLFGHDCDSPESTFVIDPPDGWLQLPMWGLLSGESSSDETKIEYIGAGWDRSPC